MEEKQESPLDALAHKLIVIEDLRDKLVHVKWNHESLRFLDRIVRDAIAFAREQENFEEFISRASKLYEHISNCMATDVLPQGSERERLIALLDQLIQIRSGGAGPAKEIREPDREISRNEEIVLVAKEEPPELRRRLESGGFRLYYVSSLEEARMVLIRTKPAAVIIDADCGDEPLAGIALVARLRERFGLLKAPVFFASERGDLAARMEAVAAGGSGYFVKPLNIAAVVENISDRLLHASARGYRVLIVSDDSAEAYKMAGALESKGIVARVITQPTQIFQAIHRLRPNLLMIDLELKELNGTEFARAVRQHEACENLPLVLLASEDNLSRHLALLGAEGGDLLSKPLPSDYLLSAITYRLRRAQALYHKLSNLTFRDAVTGLYNRRYFLDHLERLLMAVRPDGLVAVVLITLDNLRALETVDVRVADEVVEQAARRLKSVLGRGQKAARFGAATLAVLISETHKEMLPGNAREIQFVLCDQTYQTSTKDVTLQTSIGISFASEDRRDFLSLIQQAEVACSMAREVGPDHFHIYDPSTDQGWEQAYQRRILEQIADAIDHQRMSLVFQPIVSLRGAQSERYEVFLRMYNAQGEDLLPEAVFNVAQTHRLGTVLDRWVIAKALSLLRERHAGGRSTTLFVNISPAILRDEKAVAWIEEGLDKTGVYSKDLVFEVAETTIALQPERWRKFAKDVRGMGCGFALDRFGMQEQSRELFRQLPTDYVKLNGRFLEELSGNPEKQQALKKIIDDLTMLKIDTIVSGIEDLPTLQAIWSCGVEHVQGFFLQRPHDKMDYTFNKNVL